MIFARFFDCPIFSSILPLDSFIFY
jgi:hypothetical protein